MRMNPSRLNSFNLFLRSVLIKFIIKDNCSRVVGAVGRVSASLTILGRTSSFSKCSIPSHINKGLLSGFLYFSFSINYFSAWHSFSSILSSFIKFLTFSLSSTFVSFASTKSRKGVVLCSNGKYL